jgi:hypothetical protein
MNENVVIRPVRRADAAGIAEIYRPFVISLFTDAKSAEDFVQNIVGVDRADDGPQLIQRVANLGGDELFTDIRGGRRVGRFKCCGSGLEACPAACGGAGDRRST